jgi:calcineurin-like phosphoesterase family protein
LVLALNIYVGVHRSGAEHCALRFSLCGHCGVKPAKTWLITDTHFNHAFLIEKGHRPPNYETLIRNWWRNFVREGDTVFHLGDVILGKNGTLGAILADLPGTKILVRGNHDHESNAWYMRHGFQFVAHGILHGGVWLTHMPAAVLPSGAVLNVHGHTHGDTHHGTGRPVHCKELALENTNYRPVEFSSFVGFSPLTRKVLEGQSDGG